MLVGIVVFVDPLVKLAALSFESELYSHFLLVPAVSLYFLFAERERIFQIVRYAPVVGAVLVAIGAVCYWAASQTSSILTRNDFLSLCLSGFVLWLLGCFWGAYGKRAFHAAMFPLFFLIFMIPIPSFILDPTIRFLQVGSAHVTHLAFILVNIPFLRDGMVFELPGLAIEVAEQCSGIRSSLALLITSIIAGYMFLASPKRRFLLVLAVIPITLIKNAIRITTLTLLAVYIDMSWMTSSWLHSGGGIVFFVIVLALFLAPTLWLLRRWEKATARA